MTELSKRVGLVKKTAPSIHPSFNGERKVTLGFHAPQKPRTPKVQHPKAAKS